MRLFTLPTLALLALFAASAQHTVYTTITEKETGQPLAFAAVRLLHPTDSTLLAGASADSLGRVRVQNVPNGLYIFQASMVGYTAHYQRLTVRDADLRLETIPLERDSRMLDALEVTGTQVQVVAKGDTLEYNAAAFKTSENAVVEDLLRKMPGVEITSEGKIMVNGQEITKVRVDGTKFFGDDVDMATKNIPADMIDRVQVIDQKSEMAQLTGFDDGETERIINLTIRRDRRQGAFGNVQAGAGADINPQFRYDGNAFLNIMNEDTRSSITAGANNTNTSRSRRGRGGFRNQTSGITATQNLGFNIASPINNQLTLGGDAAFNHSDNLVVAETRRESYLQGTNYQTYTNGTSNRDNYDTNLRLEMEWKPDSINSIIIQPSIGHNRWFSFNQSDYHYLHGTDTTTLGRTDNNSNGTDLSGGLTLIYNRKLAKPGRTFTTRLSTNFAQTNTDGMNFSHKQTADTLIQVDQRTANTSNSRSVGLRLSFVEPLGTNRKHFLETALSVNATARNAERHLFDKDAEGNYNVKNAEYSNDFADRFLRESLEMNYRYVQPTYNLTLGAIAEPSQTYSTTVYGTGQQFSTRNEVFNIAPTARFQYNFGERNFARMEYRGQTNQPSVSQMQPVKNNTDLMNETVGNPVLKPEFNHQLRLMYSNYNAKTFSTFTLGVFGNATKDNLATNSIYDQTGKRYIQTVNATAIPYNLHSFLMFNQPFLKRFNIANRASVGIRQQYGYTSQNISTEAIDVNNLMLGNLSSTRRRMASENLTLSYTHQVADVALRGGVSYSHTQNNFSLTPSETFDWTGGLNVGIRPLKTLTLTTDLNYTKQIGYGDFAPSQWLWNATVDFTTFKGRGVISLKAYDLLRQRQNIIQTVGDNYIEYSRTNALTTYFLLSFTYKISSFKGMSRAEQSSLENMNRHRDGMPPPPSSDTGRPAGGMPPAGSPPGH